MDDPSAPRESSSGPSFSLPRPHARLRPQTAHPSSEELLAKRKDTYQPPESVTNSEPTVKRRKRSLPRDDTTTQAELDFEDLTEYCLVELVEHDHLASLQLTKLATRSVEHATIKAHPMSVNRGDDNKGVPSAAEHQELELQINEGFYNQNVQLKRKVTRLEAELLKERDWTHKAQNRVKQDMFQVLMHERDHLKKVQETAAIAKRRFDKEISQLEARLAEANRKSVRERDMREVAQATAEVYRSEAEHLQNLNTTMQADIEELRSVEVDTAMVRKDDFRGLPPAFGDLEDEERFPPYSKHADGGSLEVAHLKREVRRRFEGRISVVLAESGRKLNMFVCMSTALEEACQSLGAVLDVADNVPVSQAHSQSNRFITQQMRTVATAAEHITALTERLTTKALAKAPVEVHVQLQGTSAADKRAMRRERRSARNSITLVQSAKGAPYVADRIAKLLLDLLWRAVAACELRPKPNSLSAQMFGTMLATKYTGVDEVFLAALRLAFSNNRSLISFQFYLTQLEILAKDLKGLGIAMTPRMGNGLAHFGFFAKTLAWLNDQVEKERELRANEGPKDDPVADRLDGEDTEDGGVSSRWEGSDSDDEEEEL
jgi:hypothetical protein